MIGRTMDRPCHGTTSLPTNRTAASSRRRHGGPVAPASEQPDRFGTNCIDIESHEALTLNPPVRGDPLPTISCQRTVISMSIAFRLVRGCRSARRPFIANPNLPRRFVIGAALNEQDTATFYGATPADARTIQHSPTDHHPSRAVSPMIGSHALVWFVNGGRITSLPYRRLAGLTYVAARGASYAGVTSVIGINGDAAHLADVNDVVILISSASTTTGETGAFDPKVDQRNSIVQFGSDPAEAIAARMMLPPSALDKGKVN